ncbi:MAG: arginase family protein, partial [Dehalococcoidia bacterium]
WPGMHVSAAAIAGATLAAVRAVLRGDVDHAFSPSGGLHHAMAAYASGFCIYNDPAIAIAAALREGVEHVLYVDFDAHHGDGVQAAFYADPRVLTVSFHESGRYLFPGSGEADERGAGAGEGFAVNVPLQPYTEDGRWIEAVEDTLPSLCRAFVPDLIVSQHGCDGHVGDPLTHLALTLRAFRQQTGLVHALAHEVSDGRWVACGGGGYQPIRVVPRAWAALWAEMCGFLLPEALPSRWLERWSPRSVEPIPRSFAGP